MAEETTPPPVKETPAPLTPAQQTAKDDLTIKNAPSQGTLDVANANAYKPNATQEVKDEAKTLAKKKAAADRIKAKRASAAQAEADANAGKPCNIDDATSKQAASCEKLKASNADFAQCCKEAKTASDAVKCQKAKMNYVKPPPPPPPPKKGEKPPKKGEKPPKKGEKPPKKGEKPPKTAIPGCTLPPDPDVDGSKKALKDAEQKKEASEKNLEKAIKYISYSEDKIED